MGNPIIFLFLVILVLSLSDRESFEKATRTYKTTVDYFKNQHPPSKEKIENEIILSLNFLFTSSGVRRTRPVLILYAVQWRQTRTSNANSSGS